MGYIQWIDNQRETQEKLTCGKNIYIWYMKKFNFNDKEYNLVTDWSEITLGKWIKLMKSKEKNENLGQITILDNDIVRLETIEILADAEPGEFDEMSIGELMDLERECIGMSNVPQYDSSTKIDDHWIVDGVLYSYKKRFEEYTTGEVADIKHIISNKKNDYDHIVDCAVIMIRPAKETKTPAGLTHYKLEPRMIQDQLKIRSVVLDMKMRDVLVVSNFFLSGLNASIINTLDYMEERMEAKKDHNYQENLNG